jgi:hypothetical protein
MLPVDYSFFVFGFLLSCTGVRRSTLSSFRAAGNPSLQSLDSRRRGMMDRMLH